MNNIKPKWNNHLHTGGFILLIIILIVLFYAYVYVSNHFISANPKIINSATIENKINTGKIKNYFGVPSENTLDQYSSPSGN
ncbi:MAG: hypothetical protein KGI58_01985 [Patescibacteria group bacterium]|nr:hypothetical protein [Patescibacteria group bacterium]